MIESTELIDAKNTTKFNTDYCQLSNLILNMTEDQQSLLLKQAYQIINEYRKSAFLDVILNKNWNFILGFLLGWCFTVLLLMIFAIN